MSTKQLSQTARKSSSPLRSASPPSSPRVGSSPPGRELFSTRGIPTEMREAEEETTNGKSDDDKMNTTLQNTPHGWMGLGTWKSASRG